MVDMLLKKVQYPLGALRPDASKLGLLCHLKSIVDLNAEIANCAFQLRMPN